MFWMETAIISSEKLSKLKQKEIVHMSVLIDFAIRNYELGYRCPDGDQLENSWSITVRYVCFGWPYTYFYFWICVNYIWLWKGF